MIPLFKPYMPRNVSEDLKKILYSGNLSFGSKGRKFEADLSAYIGSEYVLTISSYNQALLILLSALGVKPGDEIIASPVSCLASNQPFVVKGLQIKWADVDPNTGTLLVEDVRSKITSKTKLIVHNHFCGYVGRVDDLNTLGKEYGIPVVDDCIEAFGSKLNGNKAGNWGTDYTVFSFQTVRLPNTLEGAALVFNNHDMFEKAKLIRDYGIERKNFRDSLNEINPYCDVKLEGYGALMGECNSLIGLRQLDDLNVLLSKQRVNAKEWDSRFINVANVKPLAITDCTMPNYWVYGVLAEDKFQFIQEFRRKGFYASSVHINNNRYSVFNNQIELNGVNEFMNRFVALPSGWWVNI